MLVALVFLYSQPDIADSHLFDIFPFKYPSVDAQGACTKASTVSLFILLEYEYNQGVFL